MRSRRLWQLEPKQREDEDARTKGPKKKKKKTEVHLTLVARHAAHCCAALTRVEFLTRGITRVIVIMRAS